MATSNDHDYDIGCAIEKQTESNPSLDEADLIATAIANERERIAIKISLMAGFYRGEAEVFKAAGDISSHNKAQVERKMCYRISEFIKEGARNE